MSGKACGARENSEKQQYMLGSSFLNRQTNTNKTTNQIINAIKENRNATRRLESKTEQIEQSVLMQRSINTSQSNVNVEAIEKKFQEKLDLVNGDFKQQMKLLKDYIKVLEQKIENLENKVIKKTPEIPKKNDNSVVKNNIKDDNKNNKKDELNKNYKKKPFNKQNFNKQNFNKKKDKKGKTNVTLEIKEK